MLVETFNAQLFDFDFSRAISGESKVSDLGSGNLTSCLATNTSEL
jgi:hypothetical protein